jgi:radical SAM protein with 4Fe4S-binding SPASM domain
MKDSVIYINKSVMYVPVLNKLIYTAGEVDFGDEPRVIEVDIDDEWVECGDIVGEDIYVKFQKLYFRMMPLIVSFLVMTNRCNFNCGFCYAHANTDEDRGNFDVVWVEKLVKLVGRMDFVNFSGGEPLLEWDKVKQCVKYLSGGKWTLYTNGSLLSDEIVQFILNNNGRLFLSIDVPSSSGLKMHADVSGILKKYCEKYPELLKRIEVSSCVSCSDVGGIVSHRENLKGKFNSDFEVDYNFIFQGGLNVRSLMEVFRVDSAGLLDGSIKMENSIYRRYARWLGEWLVDGVVLTSCTPTISLNHRGDIVLCHEHGSFYDRNVRYDEMKICNIQDVDDLETLWDLYYKKSLTLKVGLRKDECHSCALRWMCGGICWANIQFNPHLCYMAKLGVPWLLKLLIENTELKNRVCENAWWDEGWRNGRIQVLV